MPIHDLFLKFILIAKDVSIFASIGFFVAILIAPLAFLKTQRQQIGCSYGEICKVNKEKFGLKVFYSGALSYAILNAISSASFGLIEGISIPFLEYVKFAPYSFAGVIFRTLLLGLMETMFIIYFDFKTIQKQKIGLLKGESNILSFAFPAFLKNTIIWLGTTMSLYMIFRLKDDFGFNISYFQTIVISLLCGLFFSIAALPMDLVCVKRVGDEEAGATSIFKIWKNNILSGGFSRICYGGMVRVLLLTIFTIATVLTNLILKK